jgi:hypothetical protein
MIQNGRLKSIDFINYFLSIDFIYFLTTFAFLQLKNSVYKHTNILFFISHNCQVYSCFNSIIIIIASIIALRMADQDKFNRNLLKALESETVAKRLAEIFQNALSDKLDNKLDQIQATVDQLRRDLETKDTHIADLRNSVTQLSSKIVLLEARINDQENNYRRDNLIFNGLEMAAADLASNSDESSSSRIKRQVLSICHEKLHCDVQPTDISSVHTIPVKRQGGLGSQAASPGSGQRLVVVRFTRRDVRDSVYFSRMKLKDHNLGAARKVFINEDLSNDARKLFAELRKRVAAKLLLGVWSKFNKLYIKKLDGSTVSISNISELN